MGFSKRKYSGDGLGIKKGPGFYLKVVAKLILNLSVFSLYVSSLKRKYSTAGTYFSLPESPPATKIAGRP